MYLDSVTEFTLFLAARDSSIQEILDHLVRVTFVQLNAEAVLISRINVDGMVEGFARSGVSQQTEGRYAPVYSLNDKYPTTDTLRKRKITWVNTLPDFGEDYPLLKDSPWPSDAKTAIFIPLVMNGTPLATLNIICMDSLPPDNEIESYLTAIGSLVSMGLYRHENYLERNIEIESSTIYTYPQNHSSKELTERQMVMLRLISEERTNRSISEILGYSESTIRQETIKIFSKLGCNGRKEAGQIFKERFKEPATN